MPPVTKKRRRRKSRIVLDLAAPPIDDISVVKKIGIPPAKRSTRVTRYPFDQLGLEDGFRIDSSRAKSVGVSARIYSQRNNVLIVVRKDPKVPGKHIVVRVK